MDQTLLPSSKTFITPTGRDLRLDLLRGFFIFQMIVDHTAEYSILYWITGGDRFFVSGAEGFLFVSGLLAGIVYYRVIQQGNLGNAVNKAVHRFIDLYLIAVTSTLLFMVFSEHLHLRWASSIAMSDSFQLMIQILTFKRGYYFADILHVYTLYFLFLPIILVFLAKGQKYPILAFSLGLYIVSWITPEAASLPTVVKNYAFIKFSAAQLLITLGLLIGYGPLEQNRFLSKPLQRRWLVTALVLAILTLIVYYLYRNPSISSLMQVDRSDFKQLVDVVFSKQNLGIGRLLAFLSFFTILFHLVSNYWNQFQRMIGWLLLPLGRHSLFSYVIHLPIIILVVVVGRTTGYDQRNPWINLLISVAAVGIVWWFANRKWLMPQPQYKRFWYTLPGIVMVTFVIFETVYRIPSVYNELRVIVAQIQQWLRVIN